MTSYFGLGVVLKVHSELEANKSMCSGCIFNPNLGFCPEFYDAKVVDKSVFLSKDAKVTSKVEKTLSCYFGKRR